MNPKEMFNIWRKRRILTLLMLLLAVVGIVGAVKKEPRTYQSTGNVVLLPSKNASKSSGDNPYLSFGGSLPVTADVLSRSVMDPRTAMQLAAKGYTQSYTVVLDPASPGPVLDVTVTGHNKAAVENTLYGVTAEISARLSQLQSGVSSPNQITALTLSIGQVPSLLLTKSARPLVVIAGFLLIVALAIPLIVDAQIARWRSRKNAESEEGPMQRNVVPSDEAADPYERLYNRPATARRSTRGTSARPERTARPEKLSRNS
jgi:hypothetical protein